MREFRVEFKRPLTVKNMVSGVEIEKQSGLCYVDVFFPDGTQATMGYIGVNAVPGDTFAPLSNCKQAVADLIQEHINKQLGSIDGPPAPVIVEYVGNDFEEDEEDDDE